MSRNAIVIALSFFVLGFLAGSVVTNMTSKPLWTGKGSGGKSDGLPGDIPPSELIAQATATVRANPEDTGALKKLAGLYFKLGNLEEAADWYGRVLVLDPKDSDALLNRGYALWKLGKPNDAMDAFRLAARSNPGDFRAWYNIAIVLNDLGRVAEASAALDKASGLNPGYPGIEALRKKLADRETKRGG
jgi:tetratricopeptide (TPR) repeat protein